MDAELIISILFICVLIYQVVDAIQMNRIEDKIDELSKEIKIIKNNKD